MSGRQRSVVKWICTVIAVAMMVMCSISIRRNIGLFQLLVTTTTGPSIGPGAPPNIRIKTRSRGILNFGAGGLHVIVWPDSLGPESRYVMRVEASAGQRWWPKYYKSATSSERSLTIPFWLPFLASGWPAVILWRTDLRNLRSRRRTRVGLCGACAYDRRGLAPNSPCPECGKPPTPNA